MAVGLVKEETPEKADTPRNMVEIPLKPAAAIYNAKYKT
jgi:hypothetical protein